MGAIGGVLILVCVVAVFHGPGEGNATPWLIAGLIGIALVLGAAIDA